jgi:hypothetical protein
MILLGRATVFLLEVSGIGQLAQTDRARDEPVDYSLPAETRGLGIEARKYFFFSQLTEMLTQPRVGRQ